MKRISLALIMFVALSLSLMAEEVVTATIALPTLQCGMCKRTIESKVGTLEGLTSIVVSVGEKTATVTFDKDVTSIEKIEKAIAKTGYTANEIKADKRAQKKLHPCCQPGAHH